MADSISAIPQQPQLGRLAQFLRYLETQNRPEFLPPQLDVMGLMAKLALPQASTVENLSYGNLPFTMPPSGTGAMIPQVKTGRKPEVADLIATFSGVPGMGAVADVGAKLSNTAADQLVRMITRNPQATAPGVLQETAMPFMQAVAPKAPSLLDSPAKSPLGFYSALEEATIPLQNKGTGQQYLAQIQKTPGVKPEEMKWTGLDDFLQSRENVTKQEIQDYLAANRVNLQEVQLGGPQGFDANRLSQLEDEFAKLKQHPIDDPSFGEEKYDEMIRLMNIRDQSTTSDLYRQADEAMKLAQRAQARGYQETANNFFRQYELLNTRAEKLDLQSMGMDNPPKFSQYTLPGGENYREILLTLPKKPETIRQLSDGSWFAQGPSGSEGFYGKTMEEAIERFQKGRASSADFQSSHFSQPNILAHMRVNDRVVDGKKTLFIEEVQSDWHQAGRKKGYQPSKIDYTPYIRDLTDDEKRMLGVDFGVLARPVNKDSWGYMPSRQEAEQWIRRSIGGEVPDAPFKTSWHELTLKRAIQEAAEKGYDKIAFTTGKTQAERYDLSKQVKSIEWNTYQERGADKLVTIYPQNGNAIELPVTKDGLISSNAGTQFDGKPLDEVIGKDIAKQVTEQRSGDLSGQGLAIGGEGMKGFYDNILPKSLDKLGKKFDARVGKTTMDGVEVWSMDITPKMRESVLTKGQPLFQFAPAAPAAGLLGGDEGE